MKVGIIRNPVAGPALVRARWAQLLAAIQRNATVVDILETRGARHATNLARMLCDSDVDLLLAVGGDGTVGEVVDGLLTSSRPQTPLAFLPQGTGTDFARNFPSAANPEAMVAALLSAPTRVIDIGLTHCRADDGSPVERYFANIASFGVPGPIGRAANRVKLGSNIPGPLRFFYHSVMEILRYRPEPIRLVLDGEVVYEGPITAVAVCNGAWFGGGMHVAPEARLDDGLFDVVVMRGAPTLKVFSLLNKIYSGAHVRSPLVSCFRARVVEAEPLGAGPVLVDTDGEAPGILPARFELLPRRLHLKSL